MAWLLALLLVATFGEASARAQMPADEAARNVALSVKDPEAQIRAILDFAAAFPSSSSVWFAAARGMRTIGDAFPNDVDRLGTFVLAMAETTKTAPADARAQTLDAMATRLVNRGVLLDLALRFELTANQVFNEPQFLETERRTHDERQATLTSRDASHTIEPFYPEQSREAYRSRRAVQYATLGRAYLLQGRVAEAEKTLHESFALAPVMETGLALSEIRENAGDDTAALDYAISAALTGKMTAPERRKLEAIYRKTHGGTLDGLETTLDTEFARRHTTPLVPLRYRATPARTDRVALAELTTGAACLPCISVDLAFDAVLQRYTRDEVALLVYHIHAPTSDPLSNASAQARTKYYNINGAPTVYVDGHAASVGEGTRAVAGPVYQALDAQIGRRLEVVAGANITARATRAGSQVKVTAIANRLGASSPSLRLHLALVEREVSYSGENGVRFHPMVVRNLAQAPRGAEEGFAVGLTGVTVEYAFDLAAIAQANLEYYDVYIADLKKRTNIDATFREKKNTIDSNRLSVVAFVQDDQSRDVLQAKVVDVAGASDPPSPVAWSLAIEAPADPVHAGDRLSARLTASLEDGWHLYSPDQAPGGPIPTHIAVPSGQPFTLAGAVRVPSPRVAADPNFGVETQFFEDEATFTLPIQVAATTPAGPHQLTVTVSYQVCTRTICLPPTSVDVSAAVTTVAKVPFVDGDPDREERAIPAEHRTA
jgi:hypothetical protein